MAAPTDAHTCWCGRSYLRKEHLQRHKATHDRPSFLCTTCDKSFTRLDLLRRHSQIHGSIVPDSRKEPACDTCHASKVKCDGGAQCALCKKRNVKCTYERPSLAKRRHAESDQDESDATTPTEPDTTNLPPWQLHEAITPMDISGSSTPSQSSEDQSPANTSNHQAWDGRTEDCAKALAHALNAVRKGHDSNILKTPSPSLRLWLDECSRVYLDQFHERWPILHSPTLDQDRDATAIAILVAVVGSWRRCSDERPRYVLSSILRALMRHLISQMTTYSFNSSQPWPLEQYQASLLCAIFTMESANSSLMSEARMLHGLVLTALRQTRMLSSEVVIHNQKTHYPGTFPPWVYAKHEYWKQLAKCALKLDVYFALENHQAPAFDLKEMNLNLSSTWAMWNANGLHVFFPRAQIEPVERDQFTMSQLADLSGPVIPFTFLAEDVELILLGMMKGVWQYNRSQRHAFFAGHGAEGERNRLTVQLNFCRDQLNQMMATTNDESEHNLRMLLRTYVGFENGLSSTEVTVARFLRFVCRGIFLYGLLDLHMSADIEHLSDVLGICNDMTDMYSDAALRKQSTAGLWAISPQGRTAVVRAMLTLRICESIRASRRKGLEKDEPIVQLALIAAATVTLAWVPRAISTCTCHADIPAFDIMDECVILAESLELQIWRENGGKLLYQGINLCCCNLDHWRERFAECIQLEGRMKQLDSLWPVMAIMS